MHQHVPLKEPETSVFYTPAAPTLSWDAGSSRQPFADDNRSALEGFSRTIEGFADQSKHISC